MTTRNIYEVSQIPRPQFPSLWQQCLLCLWLSASSTFQLLNSRNLLRNFETMDAATSVLGNPYFTVRNVAFIEFVWMKMIVCREPVMSINTVELRKWLQCVQWTVAFIRISVGSSALRRKYGWCRSPVCSPAPGSSLRLQLLLTHWSGLCTFIRIERNVYQISTLHMHFVLIKEPSGKDGSIPACS